jgi:hypothetical protein
MREGSENRKKKKIKKRQKSPDTRNNEEISVSTELVLQQSMGV